MKSVFCFLLCWGISCLRVQAQYYYQDIVNAGNTMREHKDYQHKGIRHVRILSFDGDHSPNKDFDCTKELSDDYRQVITQTRSFETGKSVILSHFDDSGRITSTLDSSNLSVNTTEYFYDSARRSQIDSLRFVSYTSKDQDTLRFTEAHVYHYDPEGRFRKMIRSKNGVPYSVISFQVDSAGRVTKEQETGKYDSVPPIYYKYNEGDQLTDIFHFNPAQQKMEPDYLFDYDQNGRLAEKTTVTMNSHDYLLWKYSYSDQGLISKEECFGKKHALLGEMDFEYKG